MGRLFAFSHLESYFRPLGWDASKSVPHRPCFSVIYVGRCFRFTHRNGQNRGLMWDFAFSGLRGRAAAMWERRPAPAARGMTGSAIPCPAPLHYMTRKLASPCFQGAWAPPIASTGRQGNCMPPAEQARSALRSRCGMQFPRRTRTAKPQARATRAARRRCADTHALRCQDNKQHSKTIDGGVRTRVPIDCRLTQIPVVTRPAFYGTMGT